MRSLSGTGAVAGAEPVAGLLVPALFDPPPGQLKLFGNRPDASERGGLDLDDGSAVADELQLTR